MISPMTSFAGWGARGLLISKISKGLGGSKAWKPGGLEARRLGGSKAWRLGGLEARRLE